MPFVIRATRYFSASHQLRLYDGSLEPLHGHNWRVCAAVRADQLDSIGVVMDFHALERRIDEVIAGWNDRHLNDLEPFRAINPSAENVSAHIAAHLRLPGSVELLSVEVWETQVNSAEFRPR